MNLPVPPKYAFPVVVAPPLMVRPPVWVPLPIVEDAAERKPEVKDDIPVNQEAPETERSEEVAFAKVLLPVHVLLFARSVEEAAVRVKVPPRATLVPLRVVTPELVRSELPMVEVAESLPFESSERRDPAARDVNQVEPEKLASVDEELANVLSAEKEFVVVVEKLVEKTPVELLYAVDRQRRARRRRSCC